MTLLAGGAPAGVSGSASARADCSQATALRLVNQFKLNGFVLPKPVVQHVCGSFTGPGSHAMAVTIRAPTCWPIQSWAVFNLKGGSWRLVLTQHDFVAPPLVVVGADIQETTPVFRPGDPRCIPSGGTHTRTWRWNGARLAAGPWRQLTPGRSDDEVFPRTFFQTPSGNVVCEAYSGLDALEGGGEAFYAGVRCVIRSGLKPQPRHGCEMEGGFTIHQVTVGGVGRAQTPGCGDDAGGVRLLTRRNVSVLGYGMTWRGGGLRCTAAITGLTCRNKGAHGFFLSRERWRAF